MENAASIKTPYNSLGTTSPEGTPWQRKDSSSPNLALSQHHKGAPKLSQLCQFLPKIHQRLQYDFYTTHCSTERQAESKSPSATEALQLLKKTFSSEPLQCHSYPSKPFIVKVDASSSSLGVVLSGGVETLARRRILPLYHLQ